MTWELTDSSFCQFRGVTRELERRFRAEGVTCVQSLLRYLSLRGQKSLLRRVSLSVRIFNEARRLGMTDVIVNAFPIGTRARVVADRFEKALFFDIETDGTGPRSLVTLIATSMNGRERTFVRDIDLMDFLEVWNAAEMIVSFNGKRFDVPVLMREFGLSRIPAHVDLMDEVRHYGLRGGLKEIERRIGFVRQVSDCQDGMDAIEMWRRFKGTGDKDALEALRAYNRDDVRSLLALFRHVLPLAIEGIV